MRQRKSTFVSDVLYAVLVVAITAFGVSAAATVVDLNVAHALSIALTSAG